MIYSLPLKWEGIAVPQIYASGGVDGLELAFFLSGANYGRQILTGRTGYLPGYECLRFTAFGTLSVNYQHISQVIIVLRFLIITLITHWDSNHD